MKRKRHTSVRMSSLAGGLNRFVEEAGQNQCVDALNVINDRGEVRRRDAFVPVGTGPPHYLPAGATLVAIDESDPQSLQLDDDTESVDFGAADVLLDGVDQVTFAFLAKQEVWGDDDGAPLLHRSPDDGFLQFAIAAMSDRSLRIRIATDTMGGEAVWQSGADELNNGAWARIGVAFDGTEPVADDRLRVTIHGSPIGGVFSGDPMPAALVTADPANRLRVGGALEGGSFGGLIDNVGIWVGFAATTGELIDLAMAQVADYEAQGGIGFPAPDFWAEFEGDLTDSGTAGLNGTGSGDYSFSLDVFGA